MSDAIKLNPSITASLSIRGTSPAQDVAASARSEIGRLSALDIFSAAASSPVAGIGLDSADKGTPYYPVAVTQSSR